MQDEGFHEIQLNGKQLVFLFMAGTAVAVVIFLCGVMVGRGVPERALASAAAAAAHTDPSVLAAEVPALTAAPERAGAEPLTARETLTYPSLLENPNPPVETLAPPEESEQAPSVRADRPAGVEPAPAVPAAPSTPVTRAASAPALAPTTGPPEPAASGSGYVVQVAAVRERAEAERMAERLAGKGYPAFVTTAGANFRVRVGRFDDRRQAESVAGRLEREEQFKPWITR